MARCWKCGAPWKVHTVVASETPQPSDGDVTICAECSVVAVLDSSSEWGSRGMTNQELDDADEESVRAMAVAINATNELRRRKAGAS